MDISVNKKRALSAALLGGVLHFVIIGGLYTYLHGPELFGYSTSTDSFGLFELFNLNMIVGAFLLGAIPAVLLVERRLFTPTVTLFVVVAAILFTSPRGLETNPRDVGISDFAFYFVLWFIPLAIAILVGGLEYLIRHLLRLENDSHN